MADEVDHFEAQERLLEEALSEIARKAGIGSCSIHPSTWHSTLVEIGKIAERAGFDILGLPIEDSE